jgi:hypothetical protein
MAIGDDAAAAGLEVYSGLENANELATMLNQRGDEIARRTSLVTPVAKGGTGADTAAGARINLGVPSVASVVDNDSAGTNDIGLQWVGPRMRMRVDGTTVGDIATAGELDALAGALGGKRDLGDGSFLVNVVSSGDIGCAGRVQAVGSRSFTVGSSWVAAALDGAGYLGIQPSAARFKQDAKPRRYSLADAATIGRLVVEYRLVAVVAELGELAPVEVGIIAERLLEAGFGEFVVFNTNDDVPGREVVSINYAQLVTVALSSLVDVAEAFADINERLLRLEGNPDAQPV